jgi:hypothetical protein
MKLPHELIEADLTHYQFRLLVVLCHLADRNGVVEASVEELATLTKVKAHSHVKTALKVIEATGLLAITRRKRNRGFYSTNRYELREPLQRLWSSNPEPLQRLTTSEPSDQVLLLIANSHITNKSISNENIKIQKVSEETMNKSWRAEQASDAEVGGIGKFGSEQSGSTPSKKDTKTRGRRDKSEWTVRDVASEFSFLVGRKFPWLPGTVNVNHLAGALGKMRKDYQTTALIELEILKMFMVDEKNFKDVGDEAPHLYKRYLAMFRTHMNKARANLDLVNPTDDEGDDFLYASDGRAFDNTLVGRKYLERYEGKLNG